ncbi:hypothetical protein [Zavarzinia sp.]|uniref:hypothetical protein n=1 Tax=Zavarzinia sp. TaxID=2027920 RepID=UPI0035671897
MVIFDANFLLLLLDPAVAVPSDPATGAPLTHHKARVDHLIATLAKQGEAIGIPMPAVAEVLVHAGSAGPAYLAIIGKSSRFELLPFDLRAAVEVAAMTKAAIDAGDKRTGSAAPWQKVKVDRQIVAIGRVAGATAIYSDDGNLATLARGAGLAVVASHALPLPPEAAQGRLDL